PLDRDAREKIHSIAVSDGEFFQRFTNSLNMLPEEKFEWENCYAAISEYPNSETFKNNRKAGDFVVNLLKELIDTRSSSDDKSIVNTQFNEDEFAMGQKSTRRVGGIAAYQNLLDKGIPDPNGQFVNDPVVIAAQKQNIQNVRDFCKKTGFPNTRWWPGGHTGRSILFCADWDPLNNEADSKGNYKASRYIGMMIGGRARITRLERTFEALVDRNAFVEKPSKEFQDDCEAKIQAMHRELVNAPKDSKQVYEPEI
ncbi:MAG: hypothetical protein WCK42_07785, partial [Myxococcaceae bacterium]